MDVSNGMYQMYLETSLSGLDVEGDVRLRLQRRHGRLLNPNGVSGPGSDGLTLGRQLLLLGIRLAFVGGADRAVELHARLEVVLALGRPTVLNAHVDLLRHDSVSDKLVDNDTNGTRSHIPHLSNRINTYDDRCLQHNIPCRSCRGRTCAAYPSARNHCRPRQRSRQP